MNEMRKCHDKQKMVYFAHLSLGIYFDFVKKGIANGAISIQTYDERSVIV
jgi:hypothetical protein